MPQPLQNTISLRAGLQTSRLQVCSGKGHLYVLWFWCSRLDGPVSDQADKRNTDGFTHSRRWCRLQTLHDSKCEVFADDTTRIIPGESKIEINNRVKITMQATEEKRNSIELNINYTKTYKLDFASNKTQHPQKLLKTNSRQNSWDSDWTTTQHGTYTLTYWQNILHSNLCNEKNSRKETSCSSLPSPYSIAHSI